MSYTVSSTEKLRKSGADFETKALLYLMNFRADSSEIHYFVVDFFNDITGTDNSARKLWDVQSKAAKSSGPKDIGRELVTLYKNFVSDFEFHEYILFLCNVPDSFRIDSSVNVFRSDNIPEQTRKRVYSGLKEECQAKTYISDKDITDDCLKDFLGQVWFVVDDKSPQDYIKAIIKNHPKIIPGDSELLAIFNEIRNAQSSKKNTLVEGIVLEQPDEVLNYGRHLSTNEIRLLVLQRIINTNPVDKGIPAPFVEIYAKFPPERQSDFLDECQRSMCRALFNKSLAQEFWEVFSRIYELLLEFPEAGVNFLYKEISTEMINSCPDFTALSLKYFIAIVKEGILQ